MMRPLLRRTSLLAVLALATTAAIAACGEDAADIPPDETADGSLPDGRTVGPDGEILLPDGALADSAVADGARADGAVADGTVVDGGADGDAADASDDGDSGDSGDSGVVPDPPGPLTLGYKDYDYNHILSTGQSNAVASGARPFTTLPHNTIPITNSQPFTNKMFQTGVMTSLPCNMAGNNGCTIGSYVAPTSFVPLVEGDSFFGGTYFVETASSAMANLISEIATTTYLFGKPDRPVRYPEKHDVLVSLHGRSGNKYVCLRKTAQTDPNRAIPSDCKITLRPAFNEGMMQAQAGYDLAVGAGKTHVVRAVTTIHGESDHNGLLGDFPMTGSDNVANKIKTYADALIEWQEDYEAGVKAITGQAEPVPLFVMGLSGWTGPGEAGSTRYSLVAAQQHEAHVRAPGKVILVAPGYFVDQGTKGNADTTPECLHQSIVGERQIGEYFAKVYAKVVFKGEAWEPVRPKTVSRAGAVVTVEYHVPVPPLTLDTTLVTAPSGVGGDPVNENNGFEYRINGRKGTRIAINSVVVSGPTTVTITLAQDPGGADHHLLYALNQRPAGSGCTGPGVQSNGALYAGGARGNLRDSDTTPSRYGYKLFNWGVQYDIVVP